MAKLLVQESNGAREFELVDLEVNIGRELDNTLRLSDPSISRHHAVIRQTATGWEVHDLGSSNGVLVNGTKLETAPLEDGDRITLGQMQLTFVDPKPAAPAEEKSPLGTVRMDIGEMAKLQAGTTAETPVEPFIPSPRIELAAPVAPAPPPGPDPVPAAAPAPWPSQGFREVAPAPAFLAPYLPAQPDEAQPVLGADGQIERGDLITRVLAGLIDFSPMIALSLLGTLLSMAFRPTLGGLGTAMGAGCLLGLVQLALWVGYLLFLPWCWMKFGASPGKKIMKLRVVPEANPAGRLDLGACVLRLLGYFVNAIIAWVIMVPIGIALVAIFGLGAGFNSTFVLATRICGLGVGLLPYLMILGAERKALEDIFSKSLVIKVDR